MSARTCFCRLFNKISHLAFRFCAAPAPCATASTPWTTPSPAAASHSCCRPSASSLAGACALRSCFSLFRLKVAVLGIHVMGSSLSQTLLAASDHIWCRAEKAWISESLQKPEVSSARCRIAASNIVFNYVLANAAVARSFSGYFASLCNKASWLEHARLPTRASGRRQN